MAKVELSTDNMCIQTEKGETILNAALKSGIPHVHACGGNAFCSTCRILVEEGVEGLPERNEKENKLADQLGLPNEVRLACQTEPKQDLKLEDWYSIK